MIKPDLTHVQSLEEFYTEIVDRQEAAHFREYTAHHRALTILCKNCETVKEIGVFQGATLAAMLLSGAKKVTGIDISSSEIEPYWDHFKSYAFRKGIEIEFKTMSSLSPESVSEAELLHIDTVHQYDHLLKELCLHAPKVSKYIVMHDTVNYRSSKGMLNAISKYITEIEQAWQIIDHYVHRVGYTVIQRVERLVSHCE